MDRVRVGCCGFPVARDRYFKVFPAVEIQQTFYQPPMLGRAQEWRQAAPKEFVFALKAWQLITHEATSPTYRRLKTTVAPAKEKNYGSFKPTDEVFSAWETIRLFALNLNARIIVFQCPASFGPTSDNKNNMVRFFHSVKRDGLTFVWEPRGDWKGKNIQELCQKLDLIHCVDPVKSSPVHGHLRYFRLHGPAGYQSHYEERDLKKILEICQGEAYCFFNNRSMFEDATRFLRLLKRRE